MNTNLIERSLLELDINILDPPIDDVLFDVMQPYTENDEIYRSVMDVIHNGKDDMGIYFVRLYTCRGS